MNFYSDFMIFVSLTASVSMAQKLRLVAWQALNVSV